MSLKRKSDLSWISDEFSLRLTDDELDGNENKLVKVAAMKSSSFVRLSREYQFGLQEQNEISMQWKNDSSEASDNFSLRLSGLDYDSSQIDSSKHIKFNALESSLFDILPSNFIKINDSMTSQSLTKSLTDQEDCDDKLMTLAMAESYVDKNISLAAKSLESKLNEVYHHHHPLRRFTNNNFVTSDVSFNQTLKSNLSGINNESQISNASINNETNRLTKLIIFNNIIKQLPRAKVLLERYKPSNPSPQINCLPGQSQKKYKRYTSYCSSCKVPPSQCNISNCEKCGASIIYCCLSCDYTSNNYSNVYNHYNCKHKFATDCVTYCLYCDKKCSSRQSLYYHVKKYHALEAEISKNNQQVMQFYYGSKLAENAEYHCYKCDYCSPDRIVIKQHIKVEHDPKIQKSKDKPSKMQKNRKRRNQLTESTAATDSQDESEGIEDLLKLHCNNCKQQNNLGQISCNNCSSSKLWYHCRNCRKKFISKISAIKHVKKHRQVENNICICGKNFVTVTGLLIHKRRCLVSKSK